MRVLILRSRPAVPGERAQDDYTLRFTSRFADRVIANLTGTPGLCAPCGPECIDCRRGYDRRLARRIARVVHLPGRLPYLLEDPARHAPDDVPAHEIILAINVHEQILLECLKRCRQWGTRGVVVPVEAGDWVSGSARAAAADICRAAGVEIALPKPFCAFDPPAGSVLAEFRRQFHIGKPHVELTVADRRIAEARVHVSAACGATYYVARWLLGRSVDDDLKFEVVAKRLHSYPCTASMEWDDQIGDTIMHGAGQAHYEILDPIAAAAPAAGEAPAAIVTPLGRTIPKPLPARDSTRNVQRARRAILQALADGHQPSLESLRSRSDLSPAAVATALLTLKQQGEIRVQGGKVTRP